MSWVVVSIVGAGAVGGALQYMSAQNAADAQEDAAKQASATSMAQYQQTREDQAPWRAAGASALGDLQAGDILPDFQGDPGYQFRLAQGTNALNASAAARGQANGGATMKALTRYGQDYASNEYNNAYNRQYNRLSEIAGFGQNANNTTTAAGTATANQIANNTMGAANAQSAGQIAMANAQSGMLTNGANTYMNYNMMNRMFPQSNTTGTGSSNMMNTTGSGYLGGSTFQNTGGNTEPMLGSYNF